MSFTLCRWVAAVLVIVRASISACNRDQAPPSPFDRYEGFEGLACWGLPFTEYDPLNELGVMPHSSIDSFRHCFCKNLVAPIV